MPIATTGWVMSFLSTGPVLQAYSAKNTPCNHWWRIPLSAHFILWALFKYKLNPSFIIDFWLTLKLNVPGLERPLGKFFLTFQGKIHLHPWKSSLEAQMEQRSFQNPIMRPGLMYFVSVHWMPLSQILSYNPVMLEPCGIHLNMGCPLAPNIL